MRKWAKRLREFSHGDENDEEKSRKTTKIMDKQKQKSAFCRKIK